MQRMTYRLRFAITVLSMAIVAASLSAQVKKSLPVRTPTPQAWAKEPDSFRGVHWGAPEKEFQELFAGKAIVCQKAPDDQYGDWRCLTGFPIAGTSVGNNFVFRSDRLVTVALLFKEEQYQQVRDVLIERYGPPTERGSTAFQNRMGASFENEDLIWRGSLIQLTLDKYFENVDQGIALFRTLEDLEAQKKKAEQQRKADAIKF
jgi:hypothetical protein